MEGGGGGHLIFHVFIFLPSKNNSPHYITIVDQGFDSTNAANCSVIHGVCCAAPIQMTDLYHRTCAVKLPNFD